MILTTYDNFVDSIRQNVLYFAQEKVKMLQCLSISLGQFFDRCDYHRRKTGCVSSQRVGRRSVKHKKLYNKTEDNDGDVNNPICDSGTDNVNMLPFYCVCKSARG